MSIITLREITAAIVRVICALETTGEAEAFCRPHCTLNSASVFEPRTIFRAIYADEVPAGFVMWKPIDQIEVVYLWRSMIDQNHQKMGYGRQAIAQLIFFSAMSAIDEYRRASCLATAVRSTSVGQSDSSRPTRRSQTESGLSRVACRLSISIHVRCASLSSTCAPRRPSPMRSIDGRSRTDHLKPARVGCPYKVFRPSYS